MLTPYLESSTWGLSADEQGALLQPLLAADATADGEVVSWPLARTVEVLVYNADLLQTLGFDAPPTTWEEFEEMACAATEAGNVGYELDYAISLDESGQFLPYLASWGIAPMAEEGDSFALESPDAIEAMQFLQGLYTQGCLVSGPTPDGSARNFGMGTHLFTTDSSARLPLYQQNVEAGYGGEWGVAPLPHTTPEPQLLLSGYSAALASGEPEAEVAGWLFLKWLSEPAQQSNWSNATGSLPLRGDVETLLAEQVAGDASTLDELLANIQPEPTLASDGMIHLLLDDAMAQIVEGADAEETLIDLTDEANVLSTPDP